MESSARGADPLPHFGRRWTVEAWPRRRAAATVAAPQWSLAAARSWGKGEGRQGGPNAPLTLGRGEARRRLRGGRRGSAVMVGGGGVGSSGRRPEVAVGVVVVGKWRRGLFIGVEGDGAERH